MWRAVSILLFLAFGGCVAKTDPYSVRETDRVLVSIGHLKTLYRGYTYPITENLELRAWVVANDRYGTFANSLLLEDESGGIEIKVSGPEKFLWAPIGQVIVVRCMGLVLGGYGGAVQLGAPSLNPDYQTGFIAEDDLPQYLSLRDQTVVEVRPRKSSIAQLKPAWVSTLVAFERVQFVEEELMLGWSDPDKAADRHLVDERGDTLLVRTAPSAPFAGQFLPRGSGYIEGILGYFNGRYQLNVVTTQHVFMSDERF